MKFKIAMSLTMLSLLTACLSTPVAYKVSKVIDEESILLPGQFSLGITQEKLAENKYRITAKLNDVGTHEKAISMTKYHASLLAEKLGFNAFTTNDKSSGSWCHSSNSVGTAGVSAATGGPINRVTVTLVNRAPNSNERRLFYAKDTKLSSKASLDEVQSEQELQRISDERNDHCFTRAKKFSAKVRSRNN